MREKELDVEYPHCRNTVNLRQFQQYKNAVRKAFWVKNRKGIASMVMVLIFAMLLIAILGIALGKASAGTPTSQPLDVAQQVIPLILPK